MIVAIFRTYPRTVPAHIHARFVDVRDRKPYVEESTPSLQAPAVYYGGWCACSNNYRRSANEIPRRVHVKANARDTGYGHFRLVRPLVVPITYGPRRALFVFVAKLEICVHPFAAAGIDARERDRA